jgi:hypothetical protein
MTQPESIHTWNAGHNLEHWMRVSTYCDRWCERCRHRSRCLMAGSEIEDLLAEIDAPPRNRAELEAELREAEEAGRAILEAEGLGDVHLTISAFPPIGDDPLLLRARGWSERAQALLEQRAAESTELHEVLGWHAFLVPNKIARALAGLHFLETCEHCRSAGSTDHQGSAKVATLGLHACISQLSRWCRVRPLDEPAMDLLLETCDLLERLQRRFPDHMSFQRPGFED